MVNPHEVVGDLVALRLMLQRLYGRVAQGLGQGDEFLDDEREAILATLAEFDLSGFPGIEIAKQRAEVQINSVFDSLRIGGASGPNG
jgi:hypothetical protein